MPCIYRFSNEGAAYAASPAKYNHVHPEILLANAMTTESFDVELFDIYDILRKCLMNMRLSDLCYFKRLK